MFPLPACSCICACLILKENEVDCMPESYFELVNQTSRLCKVYVFHHCNKDYALLDFIFNWFHVMLLLYVV